MTARIVTIADALVTALNGAVAGTFSQSFTATKKYACDYELPDLATLRVDVYPLGRSIEITTAGEDRRDIALQVWVLKKLTRPGLATEVEPLLQLCEELEGFVLRLRVDGDAAVCHQLTPVTGSQPFDVADMVTQGVFAWGVSSVWWDYA